MGKAWGKHKRINCNRDSYKTLVFRTNKEGSKSIKKKMAVMVNFNYQLVNAKECVRLLQKPQSGYRQFTGFY